MNNKAEIVQIIEQISPINTDEQVQLLAPLFWGYKNVNTFVLDFISQGQYLFALRYLLCADSAPDLKDQIVYAMDLNDRTSLRSSLSLLDYLSYYPPSEKFQQAVLSLYTRTSCPPETSRDCYLTVKLCRMYSASTGELVGNMSTALVNILQFKPPDYYSEIMWPRTWIDAARILGNVNMQELIFEALNSDGFSYISAVGASILIKHGYHNAHVVQWLESERDYYLLTEHELAQIKRQRRKMKHR